MSDVHLTDAQLVQFTATGFIVVDGERMPWIVEAKQNQKGTWCVYANGSFISDHAGHEGARWSAIQLGKAGPPDLSTRAPELWRKLVGQVVTLTATCPGCDGHGTLIPSHNMWLHRDCLASGVVTLGRFTIRLLPIIDCLPCSRPDHPALEVWPGECWVWTDPQNTEGYDRAVNLYPLPQPGQWAVQFESVDTLVKAGDAQ